MVIVSTDDWGQVSFDHKVISTVCILYGVCVYWSVQFSSILVIVVVIILRWFHCFCMFGPIWEFHNSRDFLLASYCFPAVDIVRIVCMDYIWKKAITVFVRFVTTNMRKFTQFLALGTQASTALSVTVWIYCHKRNSMAFFTCLPHLFKVQCSISRIAVVRSEKYIDIPAAAPVKPQPPEVQI